MGKVGAGRALAGDLDYSDYWHGHRTSAGEMYLEGDALAGKDIGVGA